MLSLQNGVPLSTWQTITSKIIPGKYTSNLQSLSHEFLWLLRALHDILVFLQYPTEDKDDFVGLALLDFFMDMALSAEYDDDEEDDFDTYYTLFPPRMEHGFWAFFFHSSCQCLKPLIGASSLHNHWSQENTQLCFDPAALLV